MGFAIGMEEEKLQEQLSHSFDICRTEAIG